MNEFQPRVIKGKPGPKAMAVASMPEAHSHRLCAVPWRWGQPVQWRTISRTNRGAVNEEDHATLDGRCEIMILTLW